jgi:hypothetical protein
MKKTLSIAIYILICWIFLWLWFYFWRTSYVFDDQVDDNFDKQTKCINMSKDIREYLKDEFEFDYMEDNIWKSKIWNISVWYNKKLDSCLADTTEYITLNSKDKWWNTITHYTLYNINKWYEVIKQCNDKDWCKEDYKNEVSKYK